MKSRTSTLRRYNAKTGAHGGTCGQTGSSLECLLDKKLSTHVGDLLLPPEHRSISVKNQNKGSHNTENQMTQVFINSRSALVKGSHKRPYVTVLRSSAGEILGKSKSKARSTLQGQSINGALAGEQVSNLPERLQ